LEQEVLRIKYQIYETRKIKYENKKFVKDINKFG